MKNFLTILFISLTSILLITGCGDNSETDSSSNPTIFPVFADDNNNGINDYFEGSTHTSGSLNTFSMHDPGDMPGNNQSNMCDEGTDNHNFVDNDGDGICDFAQDGSNTWHGPGWIDSDNNGINDYWQEGSSMHNQNGGMQYIDQNANMINDYFEEGTHQGNGHDFIDNDGDGICDYAQDGSNRWHGPNFVDGDGNGVCDYWQDGGRGHCGGHGHMG